MPMMRKVEGFFHTFRSGKSFPQLVSALKTLGVYNYAYYVSSGDTLFLTSDNEIELIPGQSDILYPNVACKTDRDVLIDALKIHQAGQSNYPAFCQQAARAGVNCWLVDLRKMVVSYRDSDNLEIFSETIPNVSSEP